MMHFDRRTLGVVIAAILLWLPAGVAEAASGTIVAIGTSNTRGRGVAPSQSYPAQLQAALKARGHSVRVINMGVNGASSTEVLAQASSVPRGAILVLYEYARDNDRRKGVSNAAGNMAAIQSQLAARGIKSIEVTNAIQSEFRSAIPRGMTVMDFGPHLNPQAYGELVQSLLPQVESALGR